MRLEAPLGIAAAPDHPLQRLECGVLSVLVDPGEETGDLGLEPALAGLRRHLLEPGTHLWILCPFAKEVGQGGAGVREQHVLHEGERARGALDVGEDGADAVEPRHLRPTPARSGETAGDVGAGEVPDPAIRLGEEADRDEARARAHVEPVPHPVGNADQVAGLAQHLVHPVVGVEGEQSRAGDEEAHLVLLVVVLVEELLPQRLALRMFGVDADHVHGAEAALGHQPIDVLPEGGKDFLGGRPGTYLGARLPALEAHPDLGEAAGDLRPVLGDEAGVEGSSSAKMRSRLIDGVSAGRVRIG